MHSWALEQLIRNEHARGLQGEVQEPVQRRTQDLEEILFEEGTIQFQTQLSKVKNANPDIVHVVTEEHEQVLALTEQSVKVGLKDVAEMTAEPEWGDLELREEISSDALENWVIVNAWNPTQENEVVQNFVSKFKDAHGHVPGFVGANGYDVIYILKNVIANAGSLEIKAIQQAMNDLSWGPGVYGARTWEFDENGQAAIDPYLIRWTKREGELQLETFAKGPEDI